MAGKYGFGGGLNLPPQKVENAEADRPDIENVKRAVGEGEKLGYVRREGSKRLKPGPKRTEVQGKVSIPGPKRVIDDFRGYCSSNNLTLWQGLERLLEKR